MDTHEDRLLHERVERLERVVEKLQHMLKQMNEVDFDTTERVQEMPEHIPATVLSQTVPKVEEEMKQCPFCNEMIKNQAIKCRYCGRMITKKLITEELITADKKIGKERSKVTTLLSEPSRTREEWEALIGGELLNRIGALALVFGIGFFLKYAFDNNWISETVRVLIGGGIGALLLFGAWHFHKQELQIFAQGLVGAGISILYLSVYASFNFYHLVPQTVAFVLMSAVTFITFFQALHYDSFAVSVLGWFGGFLTPFLLNTGEVNEVGLFTYIVLLDISLIAVLIKKTSWAILELLTLLATYITYSSWYRSYYTVNDLPVTVVFLTFFWGLFYTLDISRIIRPVPSYLKIRQWVPALNAVFYYVALYAMINPEYHDWMAPVTLAIGAIYLGSLLWTRHRHTGNEGILARYALTAIALLIIATGIQFSGFTLVIAWSLEALALVWCGFNWKMPYVWKAALSLFVFSTIRLFFVQFPNGINGYSPFDNFTFILNRRALAFATLSASLGVSVFPFKLLDDEIGTRIRKILHYCWALVLFVLCTVEAYDHFSDMVVSGVLLMIALSWMVYSLPMVWAGLRAKVGPVFICGISSAFLAVVLAGILGFITFDPIVNFRLALNIRTAVLVVLIAGTFSHTHWLKNGWKDYKWLPEIRSIDQIALVMLVFSLITGETKDFFEQSIAVVRQGTGANVFDEVNRLENLRQLSLSGVWLLYSILLMGSGMLRRLQGLRIIAIILFGFTILKIFIYDLSFLESLYRIFSFIGLGLILLVVSFLYQRYKSVIFESSFKKNVP